LRSRLRSRKFTDRKEGRVFREKKKIKRSLEGTNQAREIEFLAEQEKSTRKKTTTGRVMKTGALLCSQGA